MNYTKPKIIAGALAATFAVSILLVMLFPRERARFEVAMPGDITVPPAGVPTDSSLVLVGANTATTSVGAELPLRAKESVLEGPAPSYDEVVKEFDALGMRIQIYYDPQGTCRTRPSRMVGKKDAVFMYDNRSDRKITIAVGGRTYPIPALQYHLARLSFTQGLGEYQIHCDKQFNVATILVQP